MSIIRVLAVLLVLMSSGCASLFDCSYDYDKSGEKHFRCHYQDQPDSNSLDGLTAEERASTG